jgi:hypothetical protein
MASNENDRFNYLPEGAEKRTSRIFRVVADFGKIKNSKSIEDLQKLNFSLNTALATRPILTIVVICFIIGHFDRNSCMGEVTSSTFVYVYWLFSGFVLLFSTLFSFELLRNILSRIPSYVLLFICVLFSTLFATKFVVFMATMVVPELSSCLSSDIYQVLINASLVIVGSVPLTYIYLNNSSPIGSEVLVDETDYMAPTAVDSVCSKAIIEFNGKTYAAENVKLVQSESNYLRVLVDINGGSRQVLTRMTFKNFLHNVPPESGFVFRRGGWVSRSYISSTKKRGGAVYLLFEDGSEARVSRKYSEITVDTD